MRTPKYRIPFNPPLLPRDFLSRGPGLERALAWQHQEVCFYYLARNAIWHGVALLGLKPGDQVLMPSYCHGVEVDVLLHRGLRPIYYRVDRCMQADLEDIRRLMGAGIKALYAIHYLGFTQPIEPLRTLARDNGLVFIEDCALSLFSRAPEGQVGSFGDMSIFCLYKTLPVPHGGLLVLNRPGASSPPPARKPNWVSTAVYLAHRSLDSLELAWSGWGGDRMIGYMREVGSTVKRAVPTKTVAVDSDHFQPAHVGLGVSGISHWLLNRVDDEPIVATRRRNYLSLQEALDPRVRSVFPELPQGVCPLSYPVFVSPKPAVQERLWEVGVQTVNMWSRFHRDIPEERFPETAFLRRHVLELPVHQGLDARHMKFIARHVNEQARWTDA